MCSHKHLKYIIAFLLLSTLMFFGCVALLELGELGELGAGVEVGELGTLRIASSELIADEISQVKLLNNGELNIIKNGRLTGFAELIDNNSILLKNGKVVKLPGTLYTVNQDVFVRTAPFDNSTLISSEHYTAGRLVIVNDEINGWFEIALPEHKFGYIPSSSSSIAHSKHIHSHPKLNVRRQGFHQGVNYIVNQAFINNPNTKEIIVNINFEDGSFDEGSSLQLNSIAVENGYRSTPAFFSINYYIDQLGKDLILGNLSLIQKLKLNHYADYLLIGSHSIKIRLNQIQKNMLTSDLSFRLNLINLKSGVIEKTWVNTIHGNGWTDDQARDDVMRSFIQIVKQNKF